LKIKLYSNTTSPRSHCSVLAYSKLRDSMQPISMCVCTGAAWHSANQRADSGGEELQSSAWLLQCVWGGTGRA